MGQNDPQSPVTEPSERSPVSQDDPAETANKTVIVDGDPVTIDASTTAGELKDLAGKHEETVVTYQDQNKLKGLNDDDSVLKNVPDGTTLSFQPKKGNIFGTTSRATAE